MSKKLLISNILNITEDTTPPTDGLLAWYDASDRTGNTSLNDKSGNGKSLDCTITWATYNTNSIDIPYGAAYTSATTYDLQSSGEFSIVYHIDTTNSVTDPSTTDTQKSWNSRLMCMSGAYTDTIGYWTSMYGNGMLMFYNGAQIMGDNTIDTPPLGDTIVCVTASVDEFKVYINGSLVYTATNTANRILGYLSIALLGVSSYSNMNSYTYYSSYVYNKVLTESEVLQLYNYEMNVSR